MKLKTLSMILLMATFSAVQAKPFCTKVKKSEWKSETELKQMLKDNGYKIRIFKKLGDCYKMLGLNKDGKKVEVYQNPANGKEVKVRVKN